jgi:transcriptional regulator with XRE-family HTH domain
MTEPTLMSLAEKLDFLIHQMRIRAGSRITYDDLFQMTGVQPSTISRIRNGSNQDPTLSTVLKLCEAFQVPIQFFADEMTRDDAERFMQALRGEQVRQTEQERKRQETAERLAILATRAIRMDDASLTALEQMMSYVAQQQGVGLDQDPPTPP